MVRKWLLALLLMVLVASSAFAASPLDTLKTSWEQSIERMTQADRENARWVPVWTRINRTASAVASPTAAQLQTMLPAGYDPNGEIIPFLKTVANNSGGRVRYETNGYSFHGMPIPLAIVGVPKAP
jgi:hypothetical protein